MGGTVYVDLDHSFDQIERLRAEQLAAAEQKAPQLKTAPDHRIPNSSMTALRRREITGRRRGRSRDASEIHPPVS